MPFREPDEAVSVDQAWSGPRHWNGPGLSPQPCSSLCGPATRRMILGRGPPCGVAEIVSGGHHVRRMRTLPTGYDASCQDRESFGSPSGQRSSA